MVRARLHIICGNCGCNDMFEYSIDPKGQDFGDHFEPSVRLHCRNCATIHALEDNAEPVAPTEQQPVEIGELRVRLENGHKQFEFEEYNAAYVLPDGTHHLYAATIAQPPADGTNYKLKFEHLVEHAKRQDKVIADMLYDENIRRYYDTGEVWFWAGDGTDNLDTLACPVVINAGDLRALIYGRSADGLVEALRSDLVFLAEYVLGREYGSPLPNYEAIDRFPLDVADAAIAAHRAGGVK